MIFVSENAHMQNIWLQWETINYSRIIIYEDKPFLQYTTKEDKSFSHYFIWREIENGHIVVLPVLLLEVVFEVAPFYIPP